MEREGLPGRAELGRLLGVAVAARAAAAASSVREGKGGGMGQRCSVVVVLHQTGTGLAISWLDSCFIIG